MLYIVFFIYKKILYYKALLHPHHCKGTPTTLTKHHQVNNRLPLLSRPSRKLRCCDRTNSREFNDSPRIQCDVAILTHHRNFPANLTNYCRLPQLSPFRYTKGRNSALWTRCRHLRKCSRMRHNETWKQQVYPHPLRQMTT